MKRRPWHIKFPPHLDSCRKRRRQFLRHSRHRPHLRRHLVAGFPVAPRRRAHQTPAFIGHTDRRHVELRLDHKLHVLPAQRGRHPRHPRPQFPLIKRFVQPAHAHAMPLRRRGPRAIIAKRRRHHRPRVGDFRMHRLQPPQLELEPVVGMIADLGRRPPEIQVVVPRHLRPQNLHPLDHFRRRRRPTRSHRQQRPQHHPTPPPSGRYRSHGE